MSLHLWIVVTKLKKCSLCNYIPILCFQLHQTFNLVCCWVRNNPCVYIECLCSGMPTSAYSVVCSSGARASVEILDTELDDDETINSKLITKFHPIASLSPQLPDVRTLSSYVANAHFTSLPSNISSFTLSFLSHPPSPLPVSLICCLLTSPPPFLPSPSPPHPSTPTSLESQWWL